MMGKPVLLQRRRTVELVPKAPFNFDATLHKPDHFPAADNIWQPGVRWQTMLWQGEMLGLKFQDRGTTGRPRVSLTVWSREKLGRPFLDGLLDEIGYRSGFQLNLS